MNNFSPDTDGNSRPVPKPTTDSPQVEMDTTRVVITTSAIRLLQEKSGAGFDACRVALLETKGDIETASALLRTRGNAINKFPGIKYAEHQRELAKNQPVDVPYDDQAKSLRLLTNMPHDRCLAALRVTRGSMLEAFNLLQQSRQVFQVW